MDLCFRRKYTLMSRLEGGGHDLDIRSTFTIEFLKESYGSQRKRI